MSYPFKRVHEEKSSAILAGSNCAKAAVDIELLEKYDVSAPRYTSYPTAVQFSEDYTDNDYLAMIAGRMETIAPLSLYVHVPFCHAPCYYCGCNKIVTKNRKLVRQYLDHLRKEMALMRLQLNVYKRPITQMHWGGGTPTFLDDAELTELMHHIASYFHLVNDDSRDYSIELDPRTMNEERIELLRGLGFNRVSLGVQDFDEAVQNSINRVQPLAMIQEQVNYIRARAFHSLNFDLIYGLPNQSLTSIEETLDKVIFLSPDRISYYNYAHLPHRFPAQMAIDAEALPTPHEKLEMVSLIVSRLTEAGYLHLGMDHFVKPDDSLAVAMEEGNLCRNFQGYSTAKAEEIVGIGASSITSLTDVYVQNARKLKDYYAALDANCLPVEKGLNLTQEDHLRSEVIQKLICYRYLDKPDIEARFAIDFDTHFASSLAGLEPLAEDGLVELYSDSLRVTDKGSLFLRNICMLFDEYLESQTANEQRIFSRVI